ncbi:MAG: hypothetical protein ABIA74_02065 [bacterium]
MKFYLIIFLTFLFSLNNYSYCGPLSAFNLDSIELDVKVIEKIKNNNVSDFLKEYDDFDMPKNVYPSYLNDEQKFLMCKLLVCAIEKGSVNIFCYLRDSLGGWLCIDDKRVEEALEKHKLLFPRWG